MSVLRLATLCLGLMLAGCSERPRPGVPPRHVLLITVENLRADHMSSMGYERRTTALLRPDRPVVLDFNRVATTGVSFVGAFAPSSSAEISLASLLSGRLSADGQMGEGVTLAESFQQAGFRTAGFATASSFDAQQGPGADLGRGFDHASFSATDEETLAAAVAWLETEATGEHQHLTWLHLAGIQSPFEGDPFEDRHSAPAGTAGGRTAAQFVSALQSGELALHNDTRRHLNDLYDGRLLRVVQLVNSFFFLYANNFGGGGFWEDSVIAIVGTSGCELADAGTTVGGNASLTETGSHVPVLLSHRGSLTGERIFSEVIELPDVTATLQDWFGVATDSAGDGRSLLALTDSYVEREFPSHPALTFAPGIGFSARGERYRLTVRGGQQQLFDLQADPHAANDVASLHPEIVQQLIDASRARAERLGFSSTSSSQAQ